MGMLPLAGQPAPASVLGDAPKLIAAYSLETPDVMIREQRVASGTSGHRGSAFKHSFNDWFALPAPKTYTNYLQKASEAKTSCNGFRTRPKL